MAGEIQLPLFYMLNPNEYDPRRVQAAEHAAFTVLNGGFVVLETCSSVAKALGVSRQAVSSRHLSGNMPDPHFRTSAGSPLWLPHQIAELVERRNADKNS